MSDLNSQNKPEPPPGLDIPADSSEKRVSILSQPASSKIIDTSANRPAPPPGFENSIVGTKEQPLPKTPIHEINPISPVLLSEQEEQKAEPTSILKSKNPALENIKTYSRKDSVSSQLQSRPGSAPTQNRPFSGTVQTQSRPASSKGHSSLNSPIKIRPLSNIGSIMAGEINLKKDNVSDSGSIKQRSIKDEGLNRTKTMVRYDRSRSNHHFHIVNDQPHQAPLPAPHRLMGKPGKCQTVWEYYSAFITCCFPDAFLENVLHKEKSGVKQAWREKVALCVTSFCLCVFLGYFTFFLQLTSCPQPSGNNYAYQTASQPNILTSGIANIKGTLYNVGKMMDSHPQFPGINFQGLLTAPSKGGIVDASFLYPTKDGIASCTKYLPSFTPLCYPSSLQHDNSSFSPTELNYCHDPANLRLALDKVGTIYFQWPDIEGHKTRTFYKTFVLDFYPYFNYGMHPLNQEADRLIKNMIGKDASYYVSRHKPPQELLDCLVGLYKVGEIENQNYVCIAAQTILELALVIICALVLIRFILAVFFSFFMSWQLGKIKASRSLFRSTKEYDNTVGQGVTAATHPQSFSLFRTIDFSHKYRELYTMCVVTCYSEDEAGLRTTLDSLALTDYHDDYKMIFIVADGMVKGSGSKQYTGDIVLGMLELDKSMHGEDGQQNVEPVWGTAIGDGEKKQNMSKIYCGYYKKDQRRVATILVYKCGMPKEREFAIANPDKPGKPGNRGKRDSQIVLMDFLCKLMFDAPLTPLQFDLFTKWTHIMTSQNGGKKRVTPDLFEIVLMVDADTLVLPDSLSRMVSVMQRDPTVMGLCGETRIMNKSESWVSAIQVFEYFSSHHLAKAFESIFGGVTCLPGCFCMYRIKAPKPLEPELRELPNPEERCQWVPILANPDIVADYSESVVDTLHKKNLLLLGEDRYLTTLMLRTFPKRKMMFVPKALCKTQVPSQFKVLLSQRRRWINSTIHNLMELVLVRELCGIFCFSMQFVVFLELFGTATLPAAIIFTLILVINSAIGQPQWVQLGLLFGILGLPALLIFFTHRKFNYFWFLVVYLLSLPIWNFVLPTYAYWHFDDFSWGETRKVAGEKKGESHGDGGEEKIELKEIPLKRWVEWETERRNTLKSNNMEDPVGKVYFNTHENIIKSSKTEKKKFFNNFRSSTSMTLKTSNSTLSSTTRSSISKDKEVIFRSSQSLHSQNSGDIGLTETDSEKKKTKPRSLDTSFNASSSSGKKSPFESQNPFQMLSPHLDGLDK